MAKKKLNWDEPHDLTDENRIRVVGTLLPPMDKIPEEFKNINNEWSTIASKLFFFGGKLPKTKDGIDAKKAKLHLYAVLSSFQPKHEHKEAGAGWLMSMWYELPKSKK